MSKAYNTTIIETKKFFNSYDEYKSERNPLLPQVNTLRLESSIYSCKSLIEEDFNINNKIINSFLIEMKNYNSHTIYLYFDASDKHIYTLVLDKDLREYMIDNVIGIIKNNEIILEEFYNETIKLDINYIKPLTDEMLYILLIIILICMIIICCFLYNNKNFEAMISLIISIIILF
jgi:hypothetical protein